MIDMVFNFMDTAENSVPTRSRLIYRIKLVIAFLMLLALLSLNANISFYHLNWYQTTFILSVLLPFLALILCLSIKWLDRSSSIRITTFCFALLGFYLSVSIVYALFQHAVLTQLNAAVMLGLCLMLTFFICGIYTDIILTLISLSGCLFYLPYLILKPYLLLSHILVMIFSGLIIFIHIHYQEKRDLKKINS